jgi:hypothetical protein
VTSLRSIWPRLSSSTRDTGQPWHNSI